MERICTKCGKKLNDDAAFCNQCGEKAPLICLSCGNSNNMPESRFCLKCGKPLSASVAAPPPFIPQGYGNAPYPPQGYGNAPYPPPAPFFAPQPMPVVSAKHHEFEPVPNNIICIDGKVINTFEIDEAYAKHEKTTSARRALWIILSLFILPAAITMLIFSAVLHYFAASVGTLMLNVISSLLIWGAGTMLLANMTIFRIYIGRWVREMGIPQGDFVRFALASGKITEKNKLGTTGIKGVLISFATENGSVSRLLVAKFAIISVLLLVFLIALGLVILRLPVLLGSDIPTIYDYIRIGVALAADVALLIAQLVLSGMIDRRTRAWLEKNSQAE